MRKVFAPVLKTKKRPRGRPFKKGTIIGAAFRFRKGDPSPNPGGRPRSAEIGRASRALLAMEVPGDKLGRTFAERIVWQWGQEAINGNVGAGAELADRAEGKPATKLYVSTEEDPLSQMLSELTAISKRLGPPEGQTRPQLPAPEEQCEERQE